jgi:hypothetical protein
VIIITEHGKQKYYEYPFEGVNLTNNETAVDVEMEKDLLNTKYKRLCINTTEKAKDAYYYRNTNEMDIHLSD